MSTIKLSHDNYFDIEQIIKKIAEENNIKDVKSIKIRLSKDSGIIKFAVIDDWADFDEEGEEIRYTQNVEEEDSEEELLPKKKRYTIHHTGPIYMDGRGIDYITDNEYEEQYSPDEGLECILEDLTSTHPEFYDYDISIYVGSDMAGYDLAIDYSLDEVPDDVVDKINEWIWNNVRFERSSGEEE